MKGHDPSPDELDLEKDEERTPLLLKKGALPYTCENAKGEATAQNSVETKAEVPAKLYWRRFYILALFSLLCLAQGCIWMTWGPLAKSAKVAFEWNSSTIALMTNSGVLALILTSFLCSWLMEVKGGVYENICVLKKSCL